MSDVERKVLADRLRRLEERLTGAIDDPDALYDAVCGARQDLDEAAHFLDQVRG